MGRSIKLNQLDAMVTDLNYPVERETARDAFADVTLQLADGTENLGNVVAGSSDDSFESADDLENEVLNLLPRHAVGEPYQSEGEG